MSTANVRTPGRSQFGRRPIAVARSTAPLRVLHAITPSRMAGAEMFLARLLKHAAGGPIEHRCVVSSGSSALEEMRAAGIDFQPVGIGGKINVMAIARLAKAARDSGAAIIDSHLSSASWWCGWLERMGGPPSLGHVQGFTSARWHRGQKHLAACSEAVKQDLIDKGFAAEQITALHLPVDPTDVVPRRSRSQIRAEFGADEQTPIVGTFAHLSIKKGYRELIVAAERVLREMPTAQFWCFGDGVLREELQQKIKQLGLAGRFRLLGFRRDVPDLLRAIDVMALPSHREPFGLVYVEAGLCERAVIACRAGGAPEIIEHGETGLLVPPKSPAELAEAILELLTDRTRSDAMGRRGREACLASFTWPKYIEKLSEVYEQVAG